MEASVVCDSTYVVETGIAICKQYESLFDLPPFV